ncbi:MAG: hypothetical protein ACRDYZ_15255 [Acidimicrobiales bacterium]
MSPPDRRRRRARPSNVAGVVLVAVVLVLLIGGLTRVESVSGPYWRNVDRSYAAQGRVLVDRSNRSAVELRQLLAHWAGQTRRVLEVQLDLLVRTTARTARAAAALSPPAPSGDLGTRFATALADRARAVADLRGAVDGLLGMSPLPIATAGGTTPATPAAATTTATAGAATTAGGRVTLSAAQAASAMGDAGEVLERADHSYRQLRRDFARAPGGARIPASRWVTDGAAWARGPVQTVADQLVGAPSLAPLHQVVLVPSAVSVEPAPLPGGGGAPPGGALLPPTHSLGVTAVVADRGNVDERSLHVTATVTPAGGGRGERQSATISLTAGASQAVTLHRLPVDPGRTYQLTVAVAPPAGEAPGLSTSTTYTVAVAPSASPPPTTTTTTTQPTKHRARGTTTSGGSGSG